MSGWEDWISTGLYLSPGMKTDVAFPVEIVNKGWMVCYLMMPYNLKQLQHFGTNRFHFVITVGKKNRE